MRITRVRTGEGRMVTDMKDFKIAAASKDGERVDTHFGFATTYRIIKVNMDDKTWAIERVQELNFPGEETTGDTRCWGRDEGKVTFTAEALKDCKYLLVSKIGPHPQRILARSNFECLETNMTLEEAVPKIIEFEERLG